MDGGWATNYLHGLEGKGDTGVRGGRRLVRRRSADMKPCAHTAIRARKRTRADARASEPYTSVIGSFRSPKLRKLPSNGPQAALCYS